jgi:four helix bundle protein
VRNQELSDRTKQFALRVIRLYSALPKNEIARVLGHQLLRSGTSVGANYREACRGRSNAEMIAKLGIAQQELDESIYWLELLVEAELLTAKRVAALAEEADQLMRIIVASIRTINSRKR